MTYAKTKTAALAVATVVLNWGVTQLQAGETATGAVGILLGLSVYGAYQAVEETDHEAAYNRVVDTLGADTFKRLSELSADQIGRWLDERDGRTDGGASRQEVSDVGTGHIPDRSDDSK